MKKYRILQEKDDGRTFFAVQERILLFLWQGGNFRFDTIKDAEEFIDFIKAEKKNPVIEKIIYVD